MYSGLVYGLNLKDAMTPLCEKLMDFHDLSVNMLILMSILMLFSIGSIYYSSLLSLSFLDSKVLEVVWTVVPAVLLIFLASPSVSLLYYMDDPVVYTADLESDSSRHSKSGIVKIVGHQWYWSYEYNLPFYGGKEVNYDSFIMVEEDLGFGGLRLLEVDKPLVVPGFTYISFEGVTGDVMHSWTCPAFGMKIDVIPGRLNSVGAVLNQVGSFYGQCSEICGANHSFMPIEVEVI